MNSIDKKSILNLEKICNSLKIGRLDDVIILDNNNENIIYKVYTNMRVFIIKEYSKDSIIDNEDLNERKRQITTSEQLGQNGVPVILPLMFSKKVFINCRGKYYLIYEYLNYKKITNEDLTAKKVKKLANTLAIIHKLNIKSSLQCYYEKIIINFEKYLKKFKQKKMNPELIRILEENMDILDRLTKECNANLKTIQKHLCVSHNDYKLDNIVWHKDFMYIVDFDACALANPDVSFAESAYLLSCQNNVLNKSIFQEFVTTYIKKYGPLKTDFEIALKVAPNGKLQWLEYLLSKCNNKDETAIRDTIKIIKELVQYSKDKQDLSKIFYIVTQE